MGQGDTPPPLQHPPQLTPCPLQAKRRRDLEAELRDLSNQVGGAWREGGGATEGSLSAQPRPPHVLGVVGGGATELSLKPCARPPQVAALGRSLAHERGRSLAEGGALRALEIAVGGAKARVGGAFRARDRAWERLRQQQVGGVSAWGRGPAAGRGLRGGGVA